jgi:HD-like signal output (HDOD) protein
LAELLAALDAPNPDLDYIIHLMSSESALATKVMRLSNSVSFAGSQPTTDLLEAISRIGVYEAAEAVRAFSRSLAMRAKSGSSAAAANSPRQVPTSI